MSNSTLQAIIKTCRDLIIAEFCREDQQVKHSLVGSKLGHKSAVVPILSYSIGQYLHLLRWWSWIPYAKIWNTSGARVKVAKKWPIDNIMIPNLELSTPHLLLKCFFRFSLRFDCRERRCKQETKPIEEQYSDSTKNHFILTANFCGTIANFLKQMNDGLRNHSRREENERFFKIAHPIPRHTHTSSDGKLGKIGYKPAK